MKLFLPDGDQTLAQAAQKKTTMGDFGLSISRGAQNSPRQGPEQPASDRLSLRKRLDR